MISRIANAISSWDAISLLLSVLVGAVCLAFVAFNWATHFVGSGNYLAAGGIVLASVVVTLAAVARVPAALVLLFGSAVIVGTAFSIGASNLVMP
ncbi:MAG: hypothetical protein AB7I35_02840 [Ramlibacter sp.]